MDFRKYRIRLFLSVFMVAVGSLLETQLFADENIGRSVLVVIGTPGEADYEAVFRESAERWRVACSANGSEFQLIDGTQEITVQKDAVDAKPLDDKQRILSWASEKKLPEKWLILIGHGTSDRDATKFNLRGADISGGELASAMKNDSDCRWLIANCGSSSAPFINKLSGPNRVIVTGTKSGSEENFARFGEYFAQSISDPECDLDHDFSVSILEAFLSASTRVADFYSRENRLATEQSLLDDNGDSKGTPASFYRGARPVKQAADGQMHDGLLASKMIVSVAGKDVGLSAELLRELEPVELEIERLRSKKKDMDEAEYYRQLNTLFGTIIKLRNL